MATNLTALKIKDTFPQLLHVDGGPEATPKIVYSATGTATALKVGTANIEVDSLRLDGTTISTTNTNGDLVLAPNGTGSVTIAKAAITGGSISGITALAIADGGTGATTAAAARTSLGGTVTGVALFTAADAAAGRTALGLGTISTQASSSVSITGGSITGITDLAVADGGTGASTASGARTNLGLGTIATQDSSNVSITGGAISNVTFTGSFSGMTTVQADNMLAEVSIGYATSAGAGGTVTQATNKTTGVTLNKPTGQITMAAGSIGNDTRVSFTLTNSFIAATDIIVVNIASGATVDVYDVTVTAVAAGSCRIQVHNLSNAGIDEQLVLNFAVIKGATS